MTLSICSLVLCSFVLLLIFDKICINSISLSQSRITIFNSIIIIKFSILNQMVILRILSTVSNVNNKTKLHKTELNILIVIPVVTVH